MGRALWPLVAAGVVACPVGRAAANPVNTERSRLTERDEGWTAALDGSAALSRGNIERLDLGIGGALTLRTLHPSGDGWTGRTIPKNAPRFIRDRWLVTTQQRFVNVNTTNNIVNSGFFHSRYTRMQWPRFGFEGFAQVQYNELTALRARVLGGVGVRAVAIHREYFRLAGGTGYMPEYEINNTQPDDPHPAVVLNHRWNSFVSAQLVMLSGNLALQHTGYIQPRFDRFSDVRVLQAFQLEGRLPDAISLGFELEFWYDSDPPLPVRRLDLTLGSFIRLRI